MHSARTVCIWERVVWVTALFPELFLHFYPLFSTGLSCLRSFISTPLIHIPIFAINLHQLRHSYSCSMSESSCDYCDVYNLQCSQGALGMADQASHGHRGKPCFKISNGFSKQHMLRDLTLSK